MKTMQIALGFGVALLATTAMAQGKRPDIEGNWTNATMTSQTRPAQFSVAPADKGGLILQLCNDYGLGRVFLAVDPDEAGAVMIQRGEEHSLVFMATPDGGKIGSFNPEGEMRATWPAEEDVDNASWWQKADE